MQCLSSEELVKECSSGMQVQGVVPSTIKMCRLRRFVGRFLSCQKVDSILMNYLFHRFRYNVGTSLRKVISCAHIFFPIHDAEMKHWFLAVLNIPNEQSEVWDSNPDMSAYNRREDYAITCRCHWLKRFLPTRFECHLPYMQNLGVSPSRIQKEALSILPAKTREFLSLETCSFTASAGTKGSTPVTRGFAWHLRL